MPFFTPRKRIAELEAAEKRLEQAVHYIEATEGAQDQIYDILTAPYIGSSATRRGNAYRGYEYAISKIYQKYHNLDRWGCAYVRALIDWRVAQIAGNGANITAKSKETRDFLIKCFEYNGLFDYALNDIVRDGEIEAKGLEILEWNKKHENVRIRHLSYLQRKFQIVTDPDDYEEIKEVKFKDDEGGNESLTDDLYFQFWKTSGSRRNYQETPPRIASVLTDIDEVDQAMSDVRQSNRLFGFPTPTLKTDSPEMATAERQAYFGQGARVKWSIGRFLISSGLFGYAEPSGAAMESIRQENLDRCRKISFVTGTPLHLFGYPDIMSNRAVAEDTNELIWASSAYERGIYESMLTNVAKKAVLIYNKNTGSDLSLEGISATIPVVSMASVKLMTEVYLNMYDRGLLSRETLLSLLPNIEPEQELRKLEQDQARKTKAMTKNQDVLRHAMGGLENEADPSSSSENSES